MYEDDDKIQIGQRVPKSLTTFFGWKYVEPAEIDRTKPMVFCFGGSGTHLATEGNGTCKLVEKLINSASLSKNPFEIYGVTYPDVIGQGSEDEYYSSLATKEPMKDIFLSAVEKKAINCVETFSKDFVNNTLIPLITKDNKRIPTTEAARQMRKVNIVTFCYGSVLAFSVMNHLHEQILKTGYTKSEAEYIESQIALLQTSPICAESKTKETSVSFVSIEDCNCGMHRSPIRFFADKKMPDDVKVGKVYTSPAKKTITAVKSLIHEIFGSEHFAIYYLALPKDWPAFVRDKQRGILGDILPVSLTQCLRIAVMNSCNNNLDGPFVPISQESFKQSCHKFMNWANQEDSHTVASAIEKIMARQIHYDKSTPIESITYNYKKVSKK